MKNLKQNKKSENIFYGEKDLLSFLQSVNIFIDNKLTYNKVKDILDKAFNSANTKETKELFYMIAFSFGDIQNREHNIFKGAKTDKGGESLRKFFIFFIKWLAEKDIKQFISFIPLIPQYTNFENLFYYQIRTKGKKVQEIISIINNDNEEEILNSVVEYLLNVISSSKTNKETHELIAKFLNKPRFSKRGKGENKYKMLPQTFAKEKFELKLATLLSEKLEWQIINFGKYSRFIGLENYKKKYNKNQIEVLLSTKRILNFNKKEFFELLDKLPSLARFNLQKNIIDKENNIVEKWNNLGVWYKEWLENKNIALQNVLALETKQKEEGLTIDEEKLLSKNKKESKITSNSFNFIDIITKFLENRNNKKELDLIAKTLLDKINIEVPILPIVDNSSSMSYNTVKLGNNNYHSIDLAKIFATLFLAKNPDTKDEVLIRFNSKCDILYSGLKTQAKINRFMANNAIYIEKIYDHKKTFISNYDEISKLLYTSGSTDITSISTALYKWVNEIPDEKELRKEMILDYPVWLILSDGDINNSRNAKESVMKFKQDMLQYFGWDGLLVIWDMKLGVDNRASKFDSVPNVIYKPSLNIQTLTEIFTKIHDLDIIDIYTPLKSLYLNNRYDLVKEKLINK